MCTHSQDAKPSTAFGDLMVMFISPRHRLSSSPIAATAATAAAVAAQRVEMSVNVCRRESSCDFPTSRRHAAAAQRVEMFVNACQRERSSDLPTFRRHDDYVAPADFSSLTAPVVDMPAVVAASASLMTPIPIPMPLSTALMDCVCADGGSEMAESWMKWMPEWTRVRHGLNL